MTCAPLSAGICAPGHGRNPAMSGPRASAGNGPDRLPTEDPGRASMRIAPRLLLCMNTVRVAGTIADTGFDELRDLCSAAGDTMSLAIGMAGLMTALVFHSRFREAARVASDCSRLLESIADPALTLMLFAAQSMCQV